MTNEEYSMLDDVLEHNKRERRSLNAIKENTCGVNGIDFVLEVFNTHCLNWQFVGYPECSFYIYIYINSII